MITYNGHYHSPQADSIKLYFFIFHTEKMKRGPQGISKRWVLLTYLQTEQTTVDYQFILLGTVCLPEAAGQSVPVLAIDLVFLIDLINLCSLCCLLLFPVQVKLSRLCEQDKILQELETTIRMLKEDKDKLESVLDVSHQQMEQYRDQPAHQEKISYQQRLLQEDVVHIRAEISQVSTEMENAWNEYSSLERNVDWLRTALEGQMNRSGLSQKEKFQIKRELWRIEDVIAGLSSSKANYQVTISSVTNPERKLVPSVSPSSVPSLSASPSLGEMRLAQQHSPHLSPTTPTSTQHTTAALPISVSKWVINVVEYDGKGYAGWLFSLQANEAAPPRPPLPQLYSPEDHAPAVPPLPRETSVIRHTSVRGLKRQSDERKRDREIGQYTNEDNKVELRTFLSEPELLGVGGSGHMRMGALGHDGGYQTLPSRGPAGSSSRLNQSTNISSYVTLRRGASAASGLKVRLQLFLTD
ncbi:unnamed protein product [Oncorhynchus mykiss]|uniref:Pleckstrin homology domain-containing protein n=1 Tax=Oncorhynchus mykiss TaxID=8022 RepID=A0A060YS34_ONCMY|nr:unnamed protein product [Oncorhynchus mykiss]